MRVGIRHFLVVALFFIFGCSSPQQKVKHVAMPTQARIEIPGSGVAIRAFTVKPKNGDIQEVLNTFGKSLDDALLQERLASEGIVMRIIDAVDAPSIAASFGEANEERFDWHGQIMNWRDVLQRKMPSKGMLITASGIPHFVDHGYLTLLARGWQMGMERADRFYLQLLPVWHVPAKQGVIPGKNSVPSESRIFSELMIECLLDDNEALLLLANMEPQKVVTGPFDEGPAAVLLGEALMGGPVKEPQITFLLFEAHVGRDDNW